MMLIKSTNSKIFLSLSLIIAIGIIGTSYYSSNETFSNIVTNVYDQNNLHVDSAFAEQKSQLSLIDLFEKTEDGVVQISTSSSSLFSNGVGSGVVYDKNGHIITNHHVIQGAESINVRFTDGKSYKATMVGTDPSSDLAVIKIDADRDYVTLPIGDSSDVKVGQKVAAIGNPFGLSGSMSAGIVSQIGRFLPSQDDSRFSISDIIQTDAAINPGNSGGPLLNMYGEVIGINSAILSRTGDFNGVGLAIPSNIVLKVIPVLINDGEFKHPWIGITGQTVDPDLAKILGIDTTQSVLIVSVVHDSPADKAGLKGSSITKMIDGLEYVIGGDIIVSIDGKEIRSMNDIIIHLQREKTVGEKMDLGILRDGKPMNIELTLGARP